MTPFPMHSASGQTLSTYPVCQWCFIYVNSTVTSAILNLSVVNEEVTSGITSVTGTSHTGTISEAVRVHPTFHILSGGVNIGNIFPCRSFTMLDVALWLGFFPLELFM